MIVSIRRRSWGIWQEMKYGSWRRKLLFMIIRKMRIWGSNTPTNSPNNTTMASAKQSPKHSASQKMNPQPKHDYDEKYFCQMTEMTVHHYRKIRMVWLLIRRIYRVVVIIRVVRGMRGWLWRRKSPNEKPATATPSNTKKTPPIETNHKNSNISINHKHSKIMPKKIKKGWNRYQLGLRSQSRRIMAAIVTHYSKMRTEVE